MLQILCEMGICQFWPKMHGTANNLSRGVLNSVSVDLYGYGQPKPIEMAGNQSISVYFGFSRFQSVFGFPKRGLLRFSKPHSFKR